MALHHPETLVKYCTADTAGKILSNRSLRWCAPHLFCDPFELNHDTGLPFDPHELLSAAIKAATAMIFARDAPRGNTPLVTAIRRWRDEERFSSPEEAEDVLQELLSQIIDQRQAAIDQVMMDWRKFTRRLRICCFSAKPNNIAAWRQYGERHHGVAIRFQCGEFTALPKPRQVNYRGGRPDITTLREQLGVIIGDERCVPQEQFYEKFTSKPTVDSPIQEWRCFHRADDSTSADHTDATNWFDDIKFECNEITGVYFGIYTDTAVKRKLCELLKAQYSHAKIFQARAVPGKYEVDFERITTRK
ncbi:DUF2971 domain-containing protein [Exilibacterium tricleocarpae]|uniref:DUF2971 domain-containing protein n=1 Tax=Exilibacterium tricleocarpae TaxID=2591008 RepID=A0A545TQI2_9GAMM|nr:DUF2971 domain-containing protein [Exilibacterium tricleocarpae]TQV79492.1 DUF2971 domain-containing protein [Exilibacterium tricleocarpae]